jgi:hypothetical protein
MGVAVIPGFTVAEEIKFGQLCLRTQPFSDQYVKILLP